MSSVIETLLHVYVRQSKENLAFGNIFVLLEVIMLGLYFYTLHQETGFRRLLLCIVPVYCALWLWEAAAYGISNINPYAALVDNGLLVAAALYSLFRMFTQDESAGIFHRSEFWICLGLFIYCLVTAAAFGFYSTLQATPENIRIYSYTSGLANIGANLIYTYALVCPLRNRKLERSY